MLAFGTGVVVCRSPVSSAMCLVMTFVALAALFITLDAFFIGIVQILVYAGAVMVLFLFIIMLLDLKTEIRRKLNLPAWIGGGLVLGGFVALLAKVIMATPSFAMTKPALANPEASDVSALGMALFERFNLPFQIIGVLLLAATIGCVVLSKKELK